MRIKFVQEFIDRIRGKHAVGRGLAVTVRDVHTSHLDKLFASFPTADFEINGTTRRHLANVNADRGVTEQTLSLLCDAFPSNRGNVKVLNIGCGKKDQMAFLQTLGFDAFGVDYDIELDSERTRFHDLNTQDDLPFAGMTFDAVICQEIIEHIENPWLLFRKVKKLLKVGGVLVVTTPNISSNASKRQFVGNQVGFFSYFDSDNLWQHINPIPYWEMIHIATFNGFETTTVSGNDEYYVSYVPTKPEASRNAKRDATIQNNGVLHYVFRNLNPDIKLYSPVPTYNYDWSSGAKGERVS
jgi:SAM-dependent methyltransferase